MKPISHRKITRFFVINPKTDRRMEARFFSRENVVIRLGTMDGDLVVPGVGYDIGKKGMRLETDKKFELGTDLQVVFPQSADNIRCFGRVTWSRPLAKGVGFECGVAISDWYGVTQGGQSYGKFKGIKVKPDRRIKPR